MEGRFGANFGIPYPFRMDCEYPYFESRLSLVADQRIPLMAMTAQFYFGHRAWLLWNKNRWIKWFFIVVPTITMMCGVA
jgi:hypothetical protein